MVKAVARTTTRLHFDDLDPRRFEDLCLALLYPLNPWEDIRHYGRGGTDGGVDVLAVERLADARERTWVVQCRRYRRATKATLEKAVRDALTKMVSPPDVLLVVVSCDVSRSAHEAYVRYAASRGIGTPMLWTQSLVEAKLYAERRDLLFAFFGLSEALDSRSRERTVVRNVALKRRMRTALLRSSRGTPVSRMPYDKFVTTEAIIHSVDDSSYPNEPADCHGIWSWYKVEFFDFYWNGLKVIIGMDRVVVAADGRWALLDLKCGDLPGGLREETVFRIGHIPYRDIVEYDDVGDEFSSVPHIYCRFAEGGTPYEEISYALAAEKQYPFPFDRDRRVGFDTLVPKGAG